MYRFGDDRSDRDMISPQDPARFQLPQRLQNRMKGVINIVLCPIVFSTQSQPPRPAGYGLVKLVACTDSGEMIEALYKHNRSKLHRAGLPDHPPALSLPPLSGVHPRSAEYIDADEIELDDFIVPTETEADHVAEQACDAYEKAKMPESTDLSFRKWDRLLDPLAAKEEMETREPWRASLQRAGERFEYLQGESELESAHLVADLVKNWRIIDVKEDSRALEGWLESFASKSDVELEAVPYPRASAENAHHLLLNHYNGLINAFVQSLSDKVTDRNRVNRERLVRQIAGSAALASLMLKSKPAASYLDSPSRDPALLPSSPGPESDDQGLSQSSAPGTPVNSEEPAVMRLRKYTTFLHLVPPLLLDHDTSTSVVLRHLPTSMQEDPDDYSYRGTNQRMKLAQDQLATESLDPKQKKKALKSATRLQRKLERNQLIGQEAELQRTLLPSISAGKRLSTLPGREVQSSQAAVPVSSQITSQRNVVPGLTLTQPERGAFGTRQVAKKAKKRREGF